MPHCLVYISPELEKKTLGLWERDLAKANLVPRTFTLAWGLLGAMG